MAKRLLSVLKIVNLSSDPASGTAGEIYYNTVSNAFKYYNGTAWTEITGGGGASVTVSTTAPSSPQEGDLWYDSSSAKLLIYYDSTWVEASGGGGSTTDAVTLSGQPGSYYLNWTNTTNKPDPTITLSGDLTGSVTLTDLASATLNASLSSAISPTLAGATLDSIRIGITGSNEIDTVSGNLTIDSAGGTVTIDDNLIVSGDLTVNGTTTTIDTTTLLVEDKNIELAVVATPTDSTADGGGITLRGTTNKTFNWIDATDSWTSSENIELASGKVFRINGNQVLSADTLGSGVISSSLTSVGTITTGTWQGSVISATYVDTAIARLASPAFTGVPTAPTPPTSSDDTTIATTAWVNNAIGTREVVPLDDISADFDGKRLRFIPKYDNSVISFTNPHELILMINGIIQKASHPDIVWQSGIPREGFFLDWEGQIQFSEAPPAGSTFDARLIPVSSSNKSLYYPFSAVDIYLGA